MRLLQWGTTISPRTTDGATEVLHHGWSCTVLRTSSGIEISGHDPLVPSLRSLTESLNIDKVVTRDGRPAAVLAQGGVYLPPWTRVGEEYGDVAATSFGVLATRDSQVYYFPSLSALDSPGEHIPIPTKGTPSIYATETRALILAGGTVFELRFKYRDSPSTYTIHAVDELAGLNVTVFPGRGDRFGAVSEAGEAFVLEPHGVEALDWPGEDALGVYPLEGYILVTCDDGVWARGNSEWFTLVAEADDFGQLGLGHCDKVKGWVRSVEGRVKQVAAEASSALVLVE